MTLELGFCQHSPFPSPLCCRTFWNSWAFLLPLHFWPLYKKSPGPFPRRRIFRRLWQILIPVIIWVREAQEANESSEVTPGAGGGTRSEPGCHRFEFISIPDLNSSGSCRPWICGGKENPQISRTEGTPTPQSLGMELGMKDWELQALAGI